LPLALPVSAVFAPERLESEAGALGSRLGACVAILEAACARPAPIELPAMDTLEPVVPLAAPSAAGAKGKHGGRKPAPSKATAFSGGIYIGKETVLRLANAGVVPAARPVAAAPGRPGGLQLFGVGALGVGLSDGDILIEVEGRPVQTEGQVVGLVLGARSRRAPQVSAVVLRGVHGNAGIKDERWSLVVAMPYID
jgi:hypothetical protein